MPAIPDLELPEGLSGRDWSRYAILVVPLSVMLDINLLLGNTLAALWGIKASAQVKTTNSF